MMKNKKTAILLINTGSPDAPTAPAVKTYLAEFLGDRRIVELPRWKWWPILHGIILQVRPKKSAQLYQNIWTEKGSPLIIHMNEVAQALEKRFEKMKVYVAMRYGQPSIADVMKQIEQDQVDRLLVVPMFAQYCPHTTVACLDPIYEIALKQRSMPQLRTVHEYHDHPAYIQALKKGIEEHWATHGRAIDKGGKLVMSFHSVPVAGIEKGDVYKDQCLHTAQLLKQALNLSDDQVLVTFQSRFGKDSWVEPFTLDTVEHLAREGVPALDLCCPGFSCDCLETLEEIAISLKEAYLENYQGKQAPYFSYIPALNASEAAIDAYEEIFTQELKGWI